MRSIETLLLSFLTAALVLPVSGRAAPVPADLTQGLSAQEDLIPPTGKRKLLRWLKARAYRSGFAAEPALHPSGGPHGGNVRTFYNPILTEDLLADKTVFRKGAAMVKELYLGGSEQVIGFAVMIKLRHKSGNRGQGWLFYETYDGSNRSAFYGQGISVCANCHRSGVDYLLSGFRPAGQ